jgi:hypothetical protein
MEGGHSGTTANLLSWPHVTMILFHGPRTSLLIISRVFGKNVSDFLQNAHICLEMREFQ